MKIKPNSIVIHDFSWGGKGEGNGPFLNGELVLYLGEIKNRKGRGIFVKKNGKVEWGWSIQRFRIVTEGEIE